MQTKLSTLIISITFTLIVVVFILFGIILYNSFIQLENASVVPEGVTTVITDSNDTIDEDIKAPEIIEDPFSGIKDNNEEIQDVDYSNQLEEYSKTIYKAFETNKENMKSGNYKVELGSSFSSLLSQSDGQDKLGSYYQSAIEAYTYDNPDVFYLSPNKMYLNIETTTKGNNVTYNVFINSGKESNYLIMRYQK